MAPRLAATATLASLALGLASIYHLALVSNSVHESGLEATLARNAGDAAIGLGATYRRRNVLTRATEDLSVYVDPLIGTTSPSVPGTISGSGNVFPGATLPFGVVKVGIDTALSGLTDNVDNANAGYTPNGNMTAVSLTHVSGTGGPPKYGVVSQMPLVGSLDDVNIADNRTYFQNRSSEYASLGYFNTTLYSEASVEMTAARHSAILKYTFPANETKHILVDLAHVIPGFDQPQEAQRYNGGALWLDPNGTSYSGYARYSNGWNEAPPWTIYFCANFSSPATESGTFGYVYDYIQAPSTKPVVYPYYEVSAFYYYGLGALFSWNASDSSEIIESRIGISWIGREEACAFVQSEVENQTFDDVLAAAKAEWNDEVLSAITIPEENTTKNETLLTMLYTALYGTAVMPTDRTGENPGWTSDEPYYDDIYTAWDIYHCTTPLYHLIYTSRYVDMIRALIDIWRYDGYMPDGRSTNYNGKTQGGSNADNILGDAYAKGLGSVSSINWADGFEAMRTNAENTPFRGLDPDAFDGGTKEGRIALPDWHSLGYISPTYSRSVSRTVEYSQNDFGLYTVAKGLGLVDEAELYLNRSQNFRNLWNPDAEADLTKIDYGIIKGFLAPRNTDGAWNSSYNVTNCAGCSWNDLTYEGLIWEYSFAAPHDIAGIIELSGGEEGFVTRLDASFVPGFSDSAGGTVGVSNGAGTTIFNPGNEVSFLTPYLYNYVPGYQYRTVEVVRNIVNSFYGVQSDSYPGNTDAGAMQSWLLWALLGLFPVNGQPVYLIGSPFFEAIDVRITAGMVGANASSEPKTLKIRAPGLNATNYYVQGIRLNGENLTRAFLWHDEIISGATLEFDVGSEASKWNYGQLPPSYSSGNYTI